MYKGKDGNYREAVLPEQLNPSPEYPSMQVQVWFPSVLLQLACGLQPPLFTAQSTGTVSHHNVTVNMGLELPFIIIIIIIYYYDLEIWQKYIGGHQNWTS